ncbi:DNA mismatch repair protein MSH7-like [Aristolochia californica]|uniref:DNA mismatch repair protein MSH7-like n=1 Tax=Aristolochia californica TaxID=171875 RepID=UPI0035D7BAF7
MQPFRKCIKQWQSQLVISIPEIGNGLNEVDSEFAPHQDYVVIESDIVPLAIFVELFAGKLPQWYQLFYTISYFDVLQSLAVTANSSMGSMCRPANLSHVSNSAVSCHEHGGSFLQITGLWHSHAVADSGLLIGPNMGGKFTLLRASCLAVILSQLGCSVPSKMCILTTVNTVFTRTGATDKIMIGESTIFIECRATAIRI